MQESCLNNRCLQCWWVKKSQTRYLEQGFRFFSMYDKAVSERGYKALSLRFGSIFGGALLLSLLGSGSCHKLRDKMASCLSWEPNAISQLGTDEKHL